MGMALTCSWRRKRSKAYRRNILALGSVFGVKPDGDWGVIVIGAAAMLTQLYWYVLRYLHMKEDAVIEQVEGGKLLKIKLNDSYILERKSGDHWCPINIRRKRGVVEAKAQEVQVDRLA